jgi:hypothetical protein
MKLMPFVLATICALPFTVGLGLYAASLMYHNERLITYVALACMFGWPVLAPLESVLKMAWIRN